jgi:hypothetical protein
MKKFTITGVRTIDEYVTYTVIAEDEDEALEMVENGEVEDNGDHQHRDAGYDEEFSVTDVEDIDEEE